MGPFNRISDDLAERLLSDPRSVEPAGGLAETVAFIRALPAVVPVAPDPALEDEMIPALAGAAHSAALEASREATSSLDAVRAAAPHWRLRLAVLGAAVALLPVLTAGLAYAGVELPDPVDEAFDAVGVDLPNQSEVDTTPAGADGEGKGKAAGGKDDSSSKDAAGTADQAPAPGGGEGSGDDGGHGNGHGKPEHAGPEATPPGHGGTPPGQGGVPPGNAGVPHGGGSGGSTGPPATPPGQGGTAAPGQGGTPPGQGGVPPGHQ